MTSGDQYKGLRDTIEPSTNLVGPKGMWTPLTREEWDEVFEYYNSTPLVPWPALEELLKEICNQSGDKVV